MDVNIHWHDETKSVMRVDCAGVWTWKDMESSIERWRASGPNPPASYSLILDIRNITFMPSDVVLHLKSAAQWAGKLNGQLIVLANNSATILVFRLFVSMYQQVGGKFRLASSEAEAFALLKLFD